MFVKKLPNGVQIILCASVKINNYKGVIEELIYNSLDADSTSIAVRIHIEEKSIQVIDNGHGIKKVDMYLIGQRHMTSKFTDLSVLKSAPVKYGLRGESLSNIMEVSKIVTITSRFEERDETWVKTFNKGKEYKLTESTKRPSKGTTVSIKGLLYNRKIQRNTVNEFNEMQEIKIFLQQISLLHNNVSFSLRDDAKNVIILQLHKKRDIYQTLYTIFNIEKKDLKEFKVEKNQYKVKAYIGTTEKDGVKNWIFLNRKFVYNESQLHNIVNNNLNRNLKYHQKILKTKTKLNQFKNCIFTNRLPNYFMFIECPYFDYISSNKTLEFKSWLQITNLLEKLVKFYLGDINLKEVKPNSFKQDLNTRHHVKEIMQKILGNNLKRTSVLDLKGLQLQNGVKGKISKRKHKKNNKEAKITLSLKKRRILDIDKNESTKNQSNKILAANNLNNNENHIPNKVFKDFLDKIKTAERNNDVLNMKKVKKCTNCNAKNIRIMKDNPVKLSENIRKVTRTPIKIIHNEKNEIGLEKSKNSAIRRFNSITHKDDNVFRIKNNKDTFINQIIDYDKKRKTNSIRLDGSVVKCKNIFSINMKERQKHNKINLNKKLKYHKYFAASVQSFVSRYDLLKTIINNKNDYNPYEFINTNKKFITPCLNKENSELMPRLTYEGHNYKKHEIIKENILHQKNQSKKVINNLAKNKNSMLWQDSGLKELTPKIFNTRYNNMHIKKKKNQMNFSIENIMINNIEKETSYSIEIITSNQNNYENFNYKEELLRSKNSSHKNNNVPLVINEKISTMVNIREKEHESKNRNENEVNSQELNTELHLSKDCVTESKKENNEKETKYKNISIQTSLQFPEIQNRLIDPVTICETVLASEDIFESEIEETVDNRNCHFDNLLVQDDNINTSHYFVNIDTFTKNKNHNTKHDSEILNNNIREHINNIHQITDPVQRNFNKFQLADTDCNKSVIASDVRYNFKNRLRFVPKGMSPIFDNCNTKYTCDSYLYEDYYQKSLYNNFIKEVHTNFEIFNPVVQNIKGELNTKDNENLQIKAHKDNAALKFDGRSLKEAKILGQIDDKFIAGILKCKNNQGKENTLQFLVLFDQHAVHERIKTEKNLSDYIHDKKWKSVEYEHINLILSIDEIIYLHNFKEKFGELGLKFTIINSEQIMINAIPEAILGKTPREDDKIVKAVRSLIVEEINAMKTQSGCISIYPKSIMDLVFSEACRFAIKFGDRLTKNECLNLIKDLSNCNTPFQCAHGRPVMAVIMDINNYKQDYKVEFEKLKKFKSL